MSGICKIVTNMKKFIKPFVLVAAAAMALASCQKNEIPAPEKQDVHFTINAGIETKTSIVESEDKDENGKPIYHAQWDGNEELGVLFAAPNAETVAKDVVVLTNNAEAGALASFQGDVTVDPTAGTFYSFYPASAFNRGYKEGDARLDLKNAQKPTATSFDPTCDILVAKPYDYEVVDGKVEVEDLEFARVMSVLRIDLKSDFEDVQNEFVESVSFTAGDVEITGYARILLDNPKFDKWASNGAQWCTVTANYDSDLVSINGASNSVYLVIAPVTIPANKDLTFEIKTKNYNISKTVKSPEMKFTAGKVSKLNLTIKEENCEKVDMTVDYSGEYLIVGKEGEKWYAAKKYTSGNYLAVSEIEFVGENIIETETISDHYMTIEKVVGGNYDGMYTIVDAGGKYLSTSSSSSNDMKAVESASKDTYWTIVKDDAKGSYSIVASKSQYSRNDMRFNYNNGTNSRVSCYDGSKTNLPYFTLFSTSLVKPDTTPKIIVENISYSAKAADTSVEILYTVKNITGAIAATVADGATMSNVSANVTEGKVTVSFAANEESAEKTATIVLSYEGAEPVSVILTQAGKTEENVPVEYTVKYTVSSTTAVTASGVAPNGSTATFKNTYTNNKEQMTKGNSQTYTLSGFNGCVIKSVTLTMKSNSSAGAGTFSLKAGTTTLASISSATTFNKWYDNTSYGSSYRPVHVTLTNDSYEIGANENVVIVLTGTTNSIYCQAVEITYQTSSGNSDSGAGNEGGETPEPEEPGQGGENPSGPVVVLSEQFDNSTTSDSSTEITTSKFSNFSGAKSKAYTSKYGGIKLGSSSAVGYITSKSLDLSSTFTVQIDACKYGSDTGNIVVTVGSQTQTISNSQLGAAGTFKTFTLTFEAATTSSTVKIATSSKRAYIDNVVITRN